MARNLVRPYFPIPPSTYDQVYLSEVIRSFSVFLEQYQNPGEGRHTNLVLTNLQSNDQGLEVGGLFQVDGFVKITQANRPHPAGNSMTLSLGTVTVIT